MTREYTTATALLEALELTGVSHLFCNLGSDHPAVLEAISERHAEGHVNSIRFITAPHEFVGLSAAQGFFQASGRMQALLVHVDAGTLSMGGAIHNVSRARIPVLMIAGTSPITDEGEAVGSRNEFIHSIQDTIDQRNITRGYSVYDHEIRTGKNVKQIVLRASQIAQSEPQGPAYLVASRECLEEKISRYDVDATKWKPIAPSALAHSTVESIGQAILSATRPVFVTTYLGRNQEAVKHLVNLAECLGIAVLEAIPSHLNFPRDHPLYLGNHWSGPPHPVLDEADVVLVVDCDVPWIKTQFKPRKEARVYHVDTDPLKVQMSLFHIDTDLSCQANSQIALEQLHDYVSHQPALQEHEFKIRSRIQDLEKWHREYATQHASLEVTPDQDGPLTPHYVLSRLRNHIDDSDVIIMNEGISNYRPVADVLRLSQPGSYFTSGATALGWHGGAAVGAKLAQPAKTVIAITGDGSFLFSIPSSVHWMARRYDAPFLTVILNNRGWKSPMLSALAVHKDGYASKALSDDLHVTFDPPCDYAQIAVASGAGYGATIKRAAELDSAVNQALTTVRGGRAAVLDVWLPKFNVGDPVG